MQEALSYDVPLVSTRYAGHFLKFLKAKGITKEVIKTHNPDVCISSDNSETYLSMNQVVSILETAEWLLNDEKAAFEFGQKLDLGVHGLFGYMLLSRESQPQRIEAVVKHIRVCLPLLDMEVIHRGRSVTIRLHDTWNVGKIGAFMAKMYMGSIYAAASKICDSISFDCGFEACNNINEWLSLAPGSQWNFSSQYNQITLSLTSQSFKKRGQKIVYSLAQYRHLNIPSPTSETLSNYSEKIREHIKKSPDQSSIERSAELLNMSSRYLRQQLAEEGSSFREISNEVRLNFANLYLCDTPMPIIDIASKLGFSDQASFTRAYRGWVGKTPGEVRREVKAQAGGGKVTSP